MDVCAQDKRHRAGEGAEGPQVVVVLGLWWSLSEWGQQGDVRCGLNGRKTAHSICAASEDGSLPYREVCEALVLPLQLTRLLLVGLMAPLSIAVIARGHSH